MFFNASIREDRLQNCVKLVSIPADDQINHIQTRGVQLQIKVVNLVHLQFMR